MSTLQLNLARKWRSKTFNEIVGQDLPVKMLKNSLYLNHYFPVYLFAGQKGCGKTSTARVFAAALNCEKLEEFQKTPKLVSVPCLSCGSCLAMQQGKHPDFIEIDAASNTGVDNVRNIIDAAALLPLMGRKKIYLIDEAHMLSKAAFNAFLKLLEEPPASVIFMLATTDTQKIIDTVRSRCFQLFFKPIDTGLLVQHLNVICNSEHIVYEHEGLIRIVQETAGCARDALNLLEQVRFAHSVVSDQAVTQVLGFLEDIHILELYMLAYAKKTEELLQRLCELHIEHFSADYIWHRFASLIRALVWVKCNLEPQTFGAYAQELHNLAQAHSWDALRSVFESMHEQESLFLKTTAQHSFIEMFLLRIAGGDFDQKNRSIGVVEMVKPVPAKQALKKEPLYSEKPVVAPQYDSVHEPVDRCIEAKSNIANSHEADRWRIFLQAVEALHDPLLTSIFSQGACTAHDEQTGVLTVQFSKELEFFKDWLDNSSAQWRPLLQHSFGAHVRLDAHFIVSAPTSSGSDFSDVKKKVDSASSVVQNSTSRQRGVESVGTEKKDRGRMRAQASSLDISDSERWEKTHLLLRYFPGIVREIQES